MPSLMLHLARRRFVRLLWPEAQVMQGNPDEAAHHRQVAKPLQRAFPDAHGPRHPRVSRQAAIGFRVGDVMEHVKHSGTADAGWIVNAGVGEARMVAQLAGACLGERLHVFLGSEMQAARRAGLDAGGFQALADSVGAECTLEHLLGLRIEFRNVEGAAGDAVLAPDAVFLLEVDDTVLILDDCAVGGAGGETARIGAVHALVLAHQPLQSAVFAGMLAELDQVPVIPHRFRHGLVGIVENGLAEWEIVPLQACDLAGLAADTGGGIDQFGDLLLPLAAGAGNGSGVAGDFPDAQGGAHASFSTFTRKPLNSGVNALGSITAGESRLAGVSAVLPSSSEIPR